MNYTKICENFRSLALTSGEAIMDIYKSSTFEVLLKSDDSPVTTADKKADEIISKGLRKYFPEVPVVTEEQVKSHDLSASVFFIVDPLDGTKEFIKRRGDFTVNIALVANGEPIRGIVYAPARQRLFYTDENGEAVEEMAYFSVSKLGLIKKIKTASSDNTALKVVASKSHRDKKTDEYISKYQCKELVNAGSSLKFCLIAAGEADLYPRFGPTMEWDTAAGHAVLSAAGGSVLQAEDRQPLKYGKPNYKNPFFIAASKSVILK
ncbi:MAG: 3'(2'),5'-bisphosphate nucleotidase CysQ [Paracoccaceae bacterium]